MPVCGYTCRTEINPEYFLLLLPTLSSERGFLTGPEARCSAKPLISKSLGCPCLQVPTPPSPPTPPPTSPQCWHCGHITWGLYAHMAYNMGVYSDLAFHICSASISPTRDFYGMEVEENAFSKKTEVGTCPQSQLASPCPPPLTSSAHLSKVCVCVCVCKNQS